MDTENQRRSGKTIDLDHDDLTRRFPLEERIYRMRCVEAWSMVVPWIGFRYTNCWHLPNHQQCEVCRFRNDLCAGTDAGQQDRFIGGGLKYPYVEGLRLDETITSAHADDRRCLWQSVTTAKWCASATDCAVEIWL